EREVLLAVEPPRLAPPAGEQEELPPEQGAPVLRLAGAAADRGAALLLGERHPGELEDLTRRDVVVRVTQLCHDGSRAHHVDAGYGGQRPRGGRDLHQGS